MVICFVYGCSHRSDRESCSFFRFPQSKKLLWGRLSRRSDRLPTSENDRICSCHFRDGSKTSNDPIYFPHNKGKLFDYGDPSTIRPKRKCITDLPEDAASQGVATTDNYEVMTDHNYTLNCHCEQRISAMVIEIKNLTHEIQQMNLKQQSKTSFSICDIQDNDRKMLLYTTLPYDMFLVIVTCLQRFQINYYAGWRPSNIKFEDQLLLCLMKLTLNLKDLDLAERFSVSSATVSNIFNTFIYALHELLYYGILDRYMPSQLKCKGSLTKSFEEFGSARASIDATEITQDIYQLRWIFRVAAISPDTL